MPSGPCLYNRSNPGKIHVDLSQSFTLHHDLVLIIFWTVYFIVLSSPFAWSFFRKVKHMRERISIRRFINRAIKANDGKRMHMEVLASGRVSFKPRFQVERKYKANVMKIVNDATPPIPLHALEEYLYEMKQRGSVLDLAGKHDQNAVEAISARSATPSNEKTPVEEARSSSLSVLKKASAKVHPQTPEIGVISPTEQPDEETGTRVEDESAGAESESDLDDQCIFVPVPYGIKIDRSKAQVIVRNGIQGIIINPKFHDSDSDQQVTETQSATHMDADDKAAAVDYNFRQFGKRRINLEPKQQEELERRRRSYPAHMMGLMTQNLQKYK